MTSPQQQAQSAGGSDRLARLPRAKIVERKNLAEDLFVIWLESSVPFAFKPGQYCTIGAGGIERAYSIVSAPFEPRLELFIEHILPEYGGKLTPMLWAQQVGDEVSIRPRAKGIFTFEPRYKDHVMVSTVTGVAPFISVLRQYIHDENSGHRFFFLEGASHQDEFGYDQELISLEQQYPDWVKFVPTVSRPQEPRNATWKGRGGRVNTLVEEHLETWGLRREETLVYVCGHPGMIEDVKQRVLPQGWNVREERFWKEDE